MTAQNTRSDPLTTLAALRPDTSGRAWGAVEQTAARERVMAAGAQAALPERRARRRYRHATIVVLSGVLVVGGAGAAAAAGGLLPQSFTDVFSGWGTTSRERGPSYGGPDAQAVGPDQADPAIDPSTARRVDSAPGPHGTVLTLVTAHATDPAYQCTAVLFESPRGASGPGRSRPATPCVPCSSGLTERTTRCWVRPVRSTDGSSARRTSPEAPRPPTGSTS